MKALWLKKSRVAMSLFESLYSIGYTIKRSMGMKKQKRLPCQVISIGNLTVGGTGKTPATIALTEKAKGKGFMPCILTRGYRGKAHGPCFVSRGEGPLLSERDAGDEPLLMAERLKGVPVVKGKDRYEAGLFALSSLPPAFSPDIFILDDGFQHWRLFRDKDILLIDATNPFGNKKLFPLGPLREPLSALSRADIIVITKTDSVVTRQGQKAMSLVEEIKRYNVRAPVFFAEHRPSQFITAQGDILTLEWGKEKELYGFCGIGNPESFRQTLLTAGVALGGFKTFRDHYRYTLKDVEGIVKDTEESGSHWIVTTGKDITRLRGLHLPENLVSLSIDFTVDEKFYEEIFNF